MIPVMFCFNDRYALPASVCFTSIAINSNPKKDYTFYILQSDISDEHKNMLETDLEPYKNIHIEFIEMADKFNEEYQKIKNHSHFSKELLYKLSCSSIFNNIDKLIISDVDVVFLDDISLILDAVKDDDSFYYAGIAELEKNECSIYDSEYYKDFTDEEKVFLKDGIRAGYLVANIKKINEDGIEKKMFSYLNNNSEKLIQIEQDVMNIVCEGFIKKIPFRYMVCNYEYDVFTDGKDFSMLKNESDIPMVQEGLKNPIQLHYPTICKPWIYTDCKKSDIWFEYFRKTCFYDKYADEIEKNKKSVNSFLVKFSRTKLYAILLKIYHVIVKK